jgi:hypothetical protein
VATEAAWLHGNNLKKEEIKKKKEKREKRKEKKEKTLDAHRPSHGRHVDYFRKQVTRAIPRNSDVPVLHCHY